MKRKSLVAILLALVLCFTMALTACKDNNDDNPPVGGGKTPPTASQWADAGISGTFNAEVKGELALSNVSESGEISMKWTGSDESSLDNTITWLKGQGYSSYGGQNAQKTVEEGGKIITYTAEKTVGGASVASADEKGYNSVLPLSFVFIETSVESKKMIAETCYITENFSIMGVDYKAGELYLDIYQAQGTIYPNPQSATWPATDIQSIIGNGVPEYTGEATSFQFSGTAIGFIKTAQVHVVDGSYDGLLAYETSLAQNGFIEGDGGFVKTLSNGNVLTVNVTEYQSTNWSTGQSETGVLITITLEKNSGSYSAWSQLDLSEFNGAGIPSYSGGTSFDLDDATQEGISTEEYEQIIAGLEIAEQMGLLDDESRIELEEARAMLALATQVKAKLITVYGTNANEADDYFAALISAEFANGIKNTAEYQFQVDIEYDEGKAMITIVKMPIELAEENGDNGDNGNVGNDEYLDWNDLPTNLKVSYEINLYGSIQTYTVTKIGNDYVVDFGADMYTYLKSSGDGTWTEYVKYGSEMNWMEMGTCANLGNSDGLGTLDFIFESNIRGLTNSANETVAGQICSVYSSTNDYISETYKINADGFVFYVEYSYSNGLTMISEISLWDTSVTVFDIDIP